MANLKSIKRDIQNIFRNICRKKEFSITVIFGLVVFFIQIVIVPHILPHVFHVIINDDKTVTIDIKDWYWHLIMSIIFTLFFSLLIRAWLAVYVSFPDKWDDFHKQTISTFSNALGTPVESYTKWCILKECLLAIQDKQTIILPNRKVKEYVDLISTIIRG